MGLEVKHVLSEERHFGLFLCAICQCLCGLDCLVTTVCSHTFCRTCLEGWLSRDPSGGELPPQSDMRCPTCNSNLRFESRSSGGGSTSLATVATTMVSGVAVCVLPLSQSQPLAYRVLRRVRVSCPLLAKHDCPWTGDYGDLQSHLLSATAHCDTQGTGDNIVASGPGGASDESDMVDAVTSSPQTTTTSEPTIDGRTVNVDRMVSSSSDAHAEEGGICVNEEEDEQDRRRSLSSSFKAEANNMFSTDNFREARDLYTKAVSVLFPNENLGLGLRTIADRDAYSGEPGCLVQSSESKKLLSALYANRAAANLKLGDHSSCVDDCYRAVSLDNDYVKAYLRGSRALVELGEFDEAYQFASDGHRFNPQSSALAEEVSKTIQLRDQWRLGRRQLVDRHEYASARLTFARLLQETSAHGVILAAARAELGLGSTDRALRMTLRVLRDSREGSGRTNADAHEIRGQCLCLMGDLQGGLSFLREALRLDPDYDIAKIAMRKYRRVDKLLKGARDAVFHRRFENAVKGFSEVLDLFDESNPLPHKAVLYGKIHSERAEALLRLKRYGDALKDASLAVYGREDLVDAWVVKSKALRGLGRHEEARDELQDIMGKWGASHPSIRRAYEQADFDVRREKRPDYYALLGVPSVASVIEIKKQYKARAFELHPDKFAGNEYTNEQRKEVENKFKLLGEAMETLCDDFKRELYDQGYDQEAIRERVAAAQQAAHGASASHAHPRG